MKQLIRENMSHALVLKKCNKTASPYLSLNGVNTTGRSGESLFGRVMLEIKPSPGSPCTASAVLCRLIAWG